MADETTTNYYTENAQDLCARYHGATPLYLAHLASLLPNKGAHILDVGAGCGRDVSYFRKAGYDAVGVDASDAMVEEGRREYGLSETQLFVDALPSLSALDEITTIPFDAVLSAATLQHVSETDLLDALYKLKNLVAPGGFLVISVPTRYPVHTASDGVERDDNGRLFCLRPPEQYKFFLERLGLSQVVSFDSEDELQRNGISWRTLVFSRGRGTELKPVETIESVLWDDKKANTYKFALIRALCNLATHRHRIVDWHSDGHVSVHIDEVAMLWIEYYWPIVESVGDSFVLQGQKFPDGSKSDMSFRTPLQQLASEWRDLGGYSAFRAAHDSGRLPVTSSKALRSTISKLRSAIQQPIRYSGNDETGKNLFRYSKSRVFLPESIWTELALMGRWIDDSVTLRWAEFSAGLRHQNPEIGFSDILRLLMSRKTDERETALAREAYTTQLASSTLECAWSGLSLTKFDVDHAIPWSLWRSNDLWNLLPAHPQTNNAKSDRLPTRQRIINREHAIIENWSILYETHPQLFLSHASAFSGTKLPGFGRADQSRLFSTFKDAVEYTAVNRGVARW